MEMGCLIAPYLCFFFRYAPRANSVGLDVGHELGSINMEFMARAVILFQAL